MNFILRINSFLFSRYKYPYNINVEENASYLNKVKRAEQAVNQAENAPKIPRRKRRLYDRPRIDRKINNYAAWRLFEEEEWIYKMNEHSMAVVSKLFLSPKQLVHACGMGCLPLSNVRSSHREFMFEDNRGNRYLLYEYRNTTDFKPNKEGYDYKNQKHLNPRLRIKKRLQPEDFWKSKKVFEFRVNATIYAEHHKFKAWLQKQIQKKQKEQSYDEFIDEKFGKVVTFNKPQDSHLFQPNKPMVTNVTPAHFEVNPKKGKQPAPCTYKCGKKLDEKYRIIHNDENKIKATE